MCPAQHAVHSLDSLLSVDVMWQFPKLAVLQVQPLWLDHGNKAVGNVLWFSLCHSTDLYACRHCTIRIGVCQGTLLFGWPIYINSLYKTYTHSLYISKTGTVRRSRTDRRPSLASLRLSVKTTYCDGLPVEVLAFALSRPGLSN